MNEQPVESYYLESHLISQTSYWLLKDRHEKACASNNAKDSATSNMELKSDQSSVLVNRWPSGVSSVRNEGDEVLERDAVGWIFLDIKLL